jgi:hypothetical protein
MMRVQKDRVELKMLSDEDDDFVDASPAERLGMMWELTAEVWSLQGQDCAHRMSSHSDVRQNSEYWLSHPPDDRFVAIDGLHCEYCGDSQRLQRVACVVQQTQG